MSKSNDFAQMATSPGKEPLDTYEEAPPRYSFENEAPPVEELNAAFSSLQFTSRSTEVTPDTCLAHLKLLHAFNALKEDVGYTDGLWGLYDSRILSHKDKKSNAVQNNLKLDDETGKRLAGLREKRWALFIARAVDRYEAWWEKISMAYLMEDDMEGESEKYSGFISNKSPLAWAENILPPLGMALEDVTLRTETNSNRCFDGLARPHAQPQSVPRRLHAVLPEWTMESWHAVGACQQRHRYQL